MKSKVKAIVDKPVYKEYLESQEYAKEIIPKRVTNYDYIIELFEIVDLQIVEILKNNIINSVENSTSFDESKTNIGHDNSFLIFLRYLVDNIYVNILVIVYSCLYSFGNLLVTFGHFFVFV